MKYEQEALFWLFYRYFLIAAVVFFVVIIVGGIAKHYDIRDAENSLIEGKIIDCANKIGSFERLDNELFNCVGANGQESYIKVDVTLNERKKSLNFGLVDISFSCGAEGNAEKLPSCSESHSLAVLDGEAARIDMKVATRVK